jgi:ferredoxin-NADP reductase/MOSC domain-containing protein YiiM
MATLVSVNVGLPRDVAWHGKTVHTGVWKSPVEGRQMARRLNIDGDGQGDLDGHGGEFRAIYVYQLGSYDYWADRMGRDDFVHGQFGENFTVTGLADDEVCIGDRYRVGDAVVEVTQPRVTCYRVGIRMDEPRMAALLTSSGRTGFYLRVLEEGLVEAGQEMVKVADGSERMTVAEANALLYRPQHPRPALQRALRIPALSPGWQASFQELLDAPPGGGNAGLTANAGPPPAWPSFRPARIVERRQESATVWSFVLELDDADPADQESDGAAGLPGQFVTVRLRPDPDGPPVLRSYSLSHPPEQRRLQISVKREDQGVGSRYLVDRDRVGETIDVAAPRGGFILHPGAGPVVLWSAGIGATPVLAMLEALVAEHSERDVWWLHGARDRAEHPFAGLVDDLLAGLSHAHRYVRYSRPGPDDRMGADYDAIGRLTAEAVTDLEIPRDAEHYLCGPSGFLEDLSAGLASMGVPPQRVRTEIFGAAPGLEPGIVRTPARAPHEPAGAPGTGPLVSFARSGVSTHFDTGYASLLELAEACDVPVRWSCRTGVCHNCESNLLAGEIGYSPDPIDAPAQGRLLICCSQPTSEVVLDL